MQLKINGKDRELDASTPTVSQLLELENVEAPDMVSVQLNGTILKREEFDSQTISPGDEVEFLYFMGGGSAPA